MIRHGLVHQSPGYVCPFCPDREHKYPRPDNLQRYADQLMLLRSQANLMQIGMYVCIILTKIKMILNSEMCLRSVQKAGVEEGDGGSATLVTDVPLRGQWTFQSTTQSDYLLILQISRAGV